MLQEGELRPQLLDRFGMSVNVKTLMDVAQRTQLVLDRCVHERVWLRGVKCDMIVRPVVQLHRWLTHTCCLCQL